MRRWHSIARLRFSMNIRSSAADATLTTAMISPVVGGLIQTWTATESRLWSVEDSAGLSALLGRGLIGRTPMPDNRFRETVLLDVENGTLVVQERYVNGSVGDSVELTATVFRLGFPARGNANPWTDLQRFLAAAAVMAESRDEFWVVERGGWNTPEEPFCFFGVVDRGGVPTAVIEAAPVPRGGAVWPDVPADRAGSTVTAPATGKSITGAGLFATSAVHSWGVSPWDVALTFGSLRDAEMPDES